MTNKIISVFQVINIIERTIIGIYFYNWLRFVCNLQKINFAVQRTSHVCSSVRLPIHYAPFVSGGG